MAEITTRSHIEDVEFKDALGERYLAYALSTIMSRSLPDIRDGLKPVHRRLLYAMLQLKLDPKSGFKKCARVVGDVIGKYHPHGDVAVYDAMVRLAQGFAVRYPLVEGQGNFGSIDGDNAAAMRYTEARLTEVALYLLEDIDSDTVDFQPTYDGSEDEPMVLPAAFPNLLANGAEGIAVGMATSIPPHNIVELCDALLHLIKYPNAGIAKLTEYVKGPDFPTGGVIVDSPEQITKAYETGKGSFRVRAKWEKEDLGRGAYQIIITEIPYQVQKSRLIERIADLFRQKKLSLLGNIQDESTEEIRIVLEPKSRAVEAEVLMESLFKTTDLETRASLNLNVLDKHASPRVMNLREALQSFLAHRIEVLVRRTNYRLGKIAHRLEVLEGFLIVYLNLDEVIRIIREEDDAKGVMMKKWKLTETQVEAILNMRLRALRKLEELAIKQEHEALSAERDALKAILADESKQWQVIAEEIKDLKKVFGPGTALGARRTDFAEAPQADISIEAFVEKEPITILCSKNGWIKALKGHANDLKAVKYKDGDGAAFAVKGYTTDKLLAFAGNGKMFTIACDKIPGGKGHGEPLNMMVEIEAGVHVVAMRIFESGSKLLVASDIGKGFVVPSDDVVAQTRTGKQLLNVTSGAKACICKPVAGDHVAVIGKNRKMVVFPLEEVPEMKRGQGVVLQKYKQGGYLSDVKAFKLEDGLCWQLGERVRCENDLRAWMGKRGAAGKLPPAGFPRNNSFGDV